MKNNTEKMVSEFKERYPSMEYLEKPLRSLIEEVVKRIKLGGKILVCGNGGSSSDSEHIVGELLKEFYIKRKIDKDFSEDLKNTSSKEDYEYMKNKLQGAIPAISLVSQTGFLTAFANDVSYDMAYAQQVYAYGGKNDVLIGISTSGNASNIAYAAQVARAKDMFVISLTGESGGRLKELSDVVLNVPEKETFKVQEYHLPLYHLICSSIEYEIFGEDK